MGDDWHEFFKDFPDLDPKNSDLSPQELERLSASAPGWRWVDEATARADGRRKADEAESVDSGSESK